MKTGEELAARNALIEKYRPYVTKTVDIFMIRLRLPITLRDELMACAFLGLVEAADRYNPESLVEFSIYARLRLRGAMIDGMRRRHGLTGRVHNFAKALRAAQEVREFQLEQEISAPGVSTGELAKLLDYAAHGAIAFQLTIEEVEEEDGEILDPNPTPEEDFERREDLQIFRRLVRRLPKKERRVIEEMYFNGKSLSEVGRDYEGRSKSWISRLHTRALEMLREHYLRITSEGAEHESSKAIAA